MFLSREIPTGEEFFDVCTSPLLHQPECPSGQVPLWGAGDTVDGRPELAIFHVKMRRRMVAEVHVYDDTVEAADGGHSLILRSLRIPAIVTGHTCWHNVGPAHHRTGAGRAQDLGWP